MTDLNELWQELDDEEAAGPGDVRRRLPSAPSFDIFLTQSRPSRKLGFFACFNEMPGSAWRELRGSHGLDVSVDTRASKPSVRLLEKDERFHSVFEALIRDLLNGLEVLGAQPLTARPLAMDFVAGRIARWQACLKAEPEGLSGEKRAGLVGELTILRWLLDSGVDALRAVTGWTGPSQAIQDFQLTSAAIEVKASRQTQPTVVRISSERQLDTTGVERLLLVHTALDERGDGGGDTLPEIVDQARVAVGRGSDAGLLLDDRLLEYGYMDLHAPRYEATSYSIRGLDWFDVRDTFPRLVESDLPAGIGDVAYSLALSACEEYRLSAIVVTELLGELAR